MAFCGNCGAETAENGVCPNCGPVAEPQQQQAYAEPPQQQVQYQQPIQQSNMNGGIPNMYRPSWLENKTATILGVIFFAPAVIFAYRLNTYAMNGEVMSGGRYIWRQLGWSLLCSIPLVGLIYGIVNINAIVDTRIRLWDRLNSQTPQ